LVYHDFFCNAFYTSSIKDGTIWDIFKQLVVGHLRYGCSRESLFIAVTIVDWSDVAMKALISMQK
jgi:hypothetical protein